MSENSTQITIHPELETGPFLGQYSGRFRQSTRRGAADAIETARQQNRNAFAFALVTGAVQAHLNGHPATKLSFGVWTATFNTPS